jgi:hypothetical protein
MSICNGLDEASLVSNISNSRCQGLCVHQRTQMFNDCFGIPQIHRGVNHARQAFKCPPHESFARATRHAAYS